MAEPSTLGETVRRWERWTDTAHRYLLPLSSAAGLGLAGVTALGAPGEVATVAPWALGIVGTGALATAIGYSRWRTHLARLPGPTVRPPGPRPRALVRPRPPEDIEHEWTDLVRRSWHTAVTRSTGGAGASAPSVRTAGDELWSHWQPLVVGALPVELVGPVPETAWIPTRPDRPTPFPDKEPGFRVVNGALLPMAPAVANTLTTAPVGPTVSNASTSPDVLSSSVPVASAPEVPPGPAPFDPQFEWLSRLGPLDERMSEALHPIPPHLRISPDSGATEEVRLAGLRLEDIAITPLCSSCSREVPEDDDWRPCPECGGPVCLPCRSEAVVFYGHTWCATCAVGRAWDHPMVVGEPERFAAVAAASPRLGPDGSGW